MNKNQNKLLTMIMGCLLLISMLFVGKEAAEYVTAKGVQTKQPCVVIDAGHGGEDPGKVGINGALEKDVNLEIALLVKRYLEENDIEVIMTRENGEGLNDTNASNKKVQDMKRRIALIDETAPVVTVSIHQNSYSDPEISGPQVFYYESSQEGKALAEALQDSLNQKLEPPRPRIVKGNTSYYLLKRSEGTLVIVECGFLTNPREAELLQSAEYQEQIAQAVSEGIQRYVKEKSQNPVKKP